MILNSPLKNVKGKRQLVDQIDIKTGSYEENEKTTAGVFEYLDTDLDKFHLTKKCGFTRPDIKSIARQVLDALSVMNKRNIVHTDLKPENLVFTRSANSISVKIIDFGVASLENEDRYRMITNPYWRSPETWLGMPWRPPADIWSFGAVIGSLLMEPGAVFFRPMGGLAGVPQNDHDREFVGSLWTIVPFPETFLQRVPKEWQETISNFSPKLAPTGVSITLSFIAEIFDVSKPDWEFVRDILQVDPKKRPTAAELLEHPWLNS